MLAFLTWLGATALRRRWPIVYLAALGLGLWLLTMIVVMPLTSAGLFALGLLEGARSNILGYLAVGLVYSAVLILARAFLFDDSFTSPSRWLPVADRMPPRRWALSAVGTSVAVLGVTYLLD